MAGERTSFTIICRTPAETKRLARELARCLSLGDIVFLQGKLGAGKTTFVQGMASGLGIKDHVTSPTFTISQEYVIPPESAYRAAEKLVHIDLYRLSSTDLNELGLEERFAEGLTVIEWAERISEPLKFVPDADRLFRIEAIVAGATREFALDVPVTRLDHLRSLLVKAGRSPDLLKGIM